MDISTTMIPAYGYINDYDTILLDGSSTVYELVKLLARNEKKNLIIITTSALTVVALSGLDSSRVIMAGGTVSYAHNTVEGHMTSKFIRDIRVDKCFIGINGIDEDFGYSTPRFEDAELKVLSMAPVLYPGGPYQIRQGVSHPGGRGMRLPDHRHPAKRLSLRIP